MIPLLRGRAVRLTGQAVALGVLVVGTAAFVSQHKQIDLVVDGKATRVSTFAGDVDGLLAAQRISLKGHDTISPAQDAALADGTRVVVTRARVLDLTVDGVHRRVWTTAATVEGALSDLGIDVRNASVTPAGTGALPAKGARLTVSTAKTVHLAADGRQKTLVTTARTVGDLLRTEHLSVGPSDLLSVPASAPLVDDLVVRLARVTEGTLTTTSVLPFATTETQDPSLYRDEKKVLDPGSSGQKVVVVRRTLVDGQEIGRRTVSESVATQPVARVVAVGTKERPAPPPAASGTVPSSGGLNWSALAQCESGGNPASVSSNGLYYGLYQFSVSTWRAVGGSGLPSQASAAEQTQRAQTLYQRGGAGQWPVCGARLTR